MINRVRGRAMSRHIQNMSMSYEVMHIASNYQTSANISKRCDMKS